MELRNIEKYIESRSRFVLVAAGNDRSRRFLSSILKRFEYEVHAVGTAKEALEIATAVNPVLIVTTRQLDAENDALGLIKSIRAANPAGAPPVIVLIPKPDPAYERDCLSTGAMVCLRPPIAVENFYRVIQVAVEAVPRMTIRITTNLSAIVDGSRMNESVREISENGAFILADTLPPLNTKLAVMIKLPDCVISAEALVIYLKRADAGGSGRSGMGLQFVRISPEDQHRIRLLIRSEMSKDIDPPPPAR